MIPGRRVVGFSLAANLVLSLLVAALLWRDPPQAAPSPAPAAPLPVPPPGDPAPQPASSRDGLTPEVVSRLERGGVSRAVLTKVLLAELERRETARIAALRRRYAPRLVPDREMRELARAADAERIRELKSAFGEEGYLAWEKEQMLQALNSARPPGDELPMSTAEADQACRMQKEFDEASRDLQAALEDGVGDPADIGRLQAEAQARLDQGLEQLLGRARFDALRGNSSPEVEVYRRFGDLNPTPDQAGAVVRAEEEYRARESALTERLRQDPAGESAIAADLAALQAAHESSLRGIFGADAYEALQRRNDPAFQALTQFAGAWELQDAEVQSVYASLNVFRTQTERTRAVAELRESAGLRVNWREIEAAVSRARAETEAALLTQIGAKRLARLKENGLLAGP